MKKDKKSLFTASLMRWNQYKNRREMPWKGERDPYRIWLSEIILQQTRVEQGWDYYLRFIRQYPTIQSLANAPEPEVFKLWEGLGYYSRCRNLLATARLITDNYQAVFPSSYEEILSLKGIGPYTAAAIASFAFHLPHAVTDGNVMRVLARYFGLDTDILSTRGKKQFSELAQDLLPKGRSAAYNQAIMDFGATICKPVGALCGECPLSKHCTAFQSDRVDQFPVKKKKPARKKRYLYYILLENKGKYAVRTRLEKDIWQHLSELWLLESAVARNPSEVLHSQGFVATAGKDHRLVYQSDLYQQALTHQQLEGFFLHVRARQAKLSDGYEWVSKKELTGRAFPKFINRFFESYTF